MGVTPKGRRGSGSPCSTPTSQTAQPQAVWRAPSSKFTTCEVKPDTRCWDIIIVGGGNAAGYAVCEFVKQCVESGKVLVISGEAIPPYERPGYCWDFFKSNVAPKDRFTCTSEKGSNQNAVWYAMNGIDLLLNTYVTEFHGGDRTLLCSNGMTYKANRAIIIATGQSPAQLPVAANAFGGEIPFDKTLSGLHYFSGQKDTMALAEEIHAVKPEKLVVVGAGILGLQAAAHIACMGISVTLVCKYDQVMPHLFPGNVAEAIEKSLTERGVSFVKANPAVDAMGKQGKLTGIRLADGTILETSSALVVMGSKPRSGVFRELNRKNDSIVVDHFFRTDCPGVYAIGAVCSMPLLNVNSRLSQEAADARHAGVLCAQIVMRDIAANPIIENYAEPERSLSVSETKKSRKKKDAVETESVGPKMYLATDLDCAFQPMPNQLRIVGPCGMDVMFLGENIADEIFSLTDPANPNHYLSVWLRDFSVLGALVGQGRTSQKKILQLAVKNQVKIDCVELKRCQTVDEAIEVLSEKIYLTGTTNKAVNMQAIQA